MQRHPSPHSSIAMLPWRRVCGAAILLAFAIGLASNVAGGHAAPPTGSSDKEPTVGGLPLFATWPKNQKPDATLILTGQTFGLLQPCGCSRPQKGGLERRAQFISTLKNKGWPVAGIDLGDLYPDKASFIDQGLLRYKTTMIALSDMGYIAVGIGKTEFEVELDKVVGQYALQEQKPPYLLAANLLGLDEGKVVPLEKFFPPAKGSNRPLITPFEVTPVGSVSVGVVGIVGRSLAEEVIAKKLNPRITFQKDNKGNLNNGPILKTAVGDLDKRKTQLKVLIYQGTRDEAKKVAGDIPEFQVILCQAEDAEPPQFPTIIERPNRPKTLIVEVGHKGRYAGVLGLFRTAVGFDFHYQVVPLEEYYVTPGKDEDAFKLNKVLPVLRTYSEQVRDHKFLLDVPRKLHAAQVQDATLQYKGSESCKSCHVGEHKAWSLTPHSHALDTLEVKAKRPTLRNFDPECVKCHTVGSEYRSGYEDETKTPHLKHVGCENCHGPGSGHIAEPKAKKYLDLLSPWKAGAPGGLPQDLLKKLAATPKEERGKIAILPIQQRTINLAANVCGKCHDPDNDPNFIFEDYWPKVNHSGLAPKGGWPATPPR